MKLQSLIIVACIGISLALPTNFKPGVQPNTPENIFKLKHIAGDDNAEYYSGQFEGDIVLSQSQVAAFMQKNGLIDSTYRWVNNTIPYEIIESDFSWDQLKYIEKGLRSLELMSCVKFVKRTTERDYVEVIGTNSGCWSYVGRLGGKQQLNLTPYPTEEGCFRLATIMHEFLHALGFYHMQSTHDRDDFVTIMWDNIQSGTENNFDKYDSNVVTDFQVKYDYSSVMHYGAYGFSVNGEPTIVPHDPNANIGQRDGLSRKDIEKLNRMYNCPLY